MALGLSNGSDREFLPLAIYDARAGRLFKVESKQGPGGWERERVDISSPPPAFAVDLGSIEVGWILFTVGAPDFQMVPLGHPLPAQPSKEHKQGFRVKVMGRALDGLREFSHTAKCVLGAVDDLHSLFEAAPEAATGKIPVVKLSGTVPVVTKGGGQTSTNYRPVFEIIQWTDRAPEMGERTVPAPGGKAAHKPAPAPAAAVPDTAPWDDQTTAKQPEPAMPVSW